MKRRGKKSKYIDHNALDRALRKLREDNPEGRETIRELVPFFMSQGVYTPDAVSEAVLAHFRKLTSDSLKTHYIRDESGKVVDFKEHLEIKDKATGRTVDVWGFVSRFKEPEWFYVTTSRESLSVAQAKRLVLYIRLAVESCGERVRNQLPSIESLIRKIRSIKIDPEVLERDPRLTDNENDDTDEDEGQAGAAVSA